MVPSARRMLGVNERRSFGQRGHCNHTGHRRGADISSIGKPSTGRGRTIVVLGVSSSLPVGIVNGFAVKNLLHFLTTIICIEGDIDNRWIIELSSCPVVKYVQYCCMRCGDTSRRDVRIHRSRTSGCNLMT
jgi:hypothetical protein